MQVNFSLHILGNQKDCIIKQKKYGTEVQNGVVTQAWASEVDDPYLDYEWWNGNEWNSNLETAGRWVTPNRFAQWSDAPGVPLGIGPVFKEMNYRTIVIEKSTMKELRSLKWGICINLSSGSREYYFNY